MSEREYRTVAKLWEPLEVEIVKSLLAEAGIPAFIKREALGGIYGLTIDGLAKVEIQVPPDRYEEAERLISSREFIYEKELIDEDNE